jgi:hypothetical protein
MFDSDKYLLDTANYVHVQKNFADAEEAGRMLARSVRRMVFKAHNCTTESGFHLPQMAQEYFDDLVYGFYCEVEKNQE